MLKRKHFFIYKSIPIPSLFIVEGFQSIRFKNKEELKHDLKFFYKKLLAKLKKQTNNFSSSSYYSTKSLSSFDYQIRDKGGIVDCNGKVHTSAQSYKNFLKDNDLVIKDWSDGSNKREMQLSDRAEIAKKLNNLI
jgi:hypothetical protein